jgi:hypothetical protein
VHVPIAIREVQDESHNRWDCQGAVLAKKFPSALNGQAHFLEKLGIPRITPEILE